MKGENDLDINKISDIANGMREDIVEMCYRLGNNAAHLGGCMSLVELLAVLYYGHLRFDINDLKSEFRDRVIMSKGQGSIAMYSAMHRVGIIKNLSEVGSLLGERNIYYKQTVRNINYGIEFSSGSLGQGLAYAVGIAWALKKKNNNTSKVYIVLGDGECDEGSVWEAASLAGHLKLDNIVVLVDRNNLQIDGFTCTINRMNMMEERWSAFGFNAVTIDGHNISEIDRALSFTSHGKPYAVIADTIKGKGISFAENEAEWHQNVLTDELYKKAMLEIRGNNYDAL